MLTKQKTLQDVSVRDVLRLHTNEAHNRLHQHSSFVALFKQSLSVDEYRMLVQRFYGFYAPLDQAIEDTIKAVPKNETSFRYERRSGLLAQDLADLDFSAREIDETPHCKQVFDLVSPMSLGGVLYVVEGATLGGTGIDRAVFKMLRHKQPIGRRYWAWCRAVNKNRWSMTNQYLQDLHVNGASLDDLITGARETFRLLANWLAPLDLQHAADERKLL